MRLKMKENSLFAILLRSPWWISFAVAAVVGLVASMLMPSPYKPLAAFSGAPFFAIGCMAAWRQLRAPKAASIAGALERAAAMPSREFLSAVSAGLGRSGYSVAPCAGAGADLRAEKDGRVLLVACRRWKAARHGVESLRELKTAIRAADAQGGMYLAQGELSEQARRYAAEAGIDVVQGVRLAQLIGL